jgi:IS30 family transposase
MSNLRDKLTDEEWHELEQSLIGRKNPYDKHDEFLKQVEKNQTERVTLKDTGDSYQRFPASDEQPVKDLIVEKVINKFKTRSALGIAKYNTTLQNNNLSVYEWLNHAQEEALDMALYLEKLKSQFKDM